MRIALAAALLGALALTPPAWAHARLLRTEPADGAVVARAPTAVSVVFDDAVRPASGIAAIRNDGRSVLGSRATVAGGRTLVIPLAARLGDGDYSVRWRIVSDDGHELSGVLAFAVGAGRAPPHSALAPLASGPDPRDVIERWLFFAGVMLAFGGAVFLVFVLPGADEGRAARPLSGLVFTGFVLALLGMHGHGTAGTRFGSVDDAGAVIALVGATATAISLVEARARWLGILAALALVSIPTLRGHALDPGEPRVLNAAADLLHVAAASAWIGGLAALVVVLTRARDAAGPLVRRFSALALGAVALLAVTGVVRALYELSAVSQLWTTGYGRALVVKSGLLALLVGLGWRNRHRLIPGGALGPLRRSAAAELALAAGLVVAIAFLTALPPGKQARAASRPPAPAAGPAPFPPRGALVLGRQAGPLAVGLAVQPAELTATVLGQDGNGAAGLRVTIDSTEATACGPGCYRVTARPGRSVTVRVGARTVVFPLPARAPRADRLVGRAGRAVRSLRSLVVHERLSSGPGTGIVATFEIAAPDRLAYRIRGGPQAVIVGARRWDRQPGGKWVRSEQSPLSVPTPEWGRVVDARLLGSIRVGGRPARHVSFFDPTIPAWFDVALDRRTALPLELRMTAAAHFMRHTYEGFGRPLRIVPPRSY